MDHGHKENVRVLDQLADTHIVLATADSADQQAISSQRPANVVLDVDQFPLQ
jgi:hypothetical protein